LRNLSIRQQLLLLICLLLLTCILLFGAISYIGIRRATLGVGKERLKNLTGQLSSMFQQSARTMAAATQATANIDDENIKLTCYRITQVQLNNIVKHARAKKATIQLRKTADRLELMLQDDGIGFNPAINTGGIGLRNIKNRVDYYNGTVRIDSEPGKGCAVTIVIPLQAQAGITG